MQAALLPPLLLSPRPPGEIVQTGASTWIDLEQEGSESDGDDIDIAKWWAECEAELRPHRRKTGKPPTRQKQLSQSARGGSLPPLPLDVGQPPRSARSAASPPFALSTLPRSALSARPLRGIGGPDLSDDISKAEWVDSLMLSEDQAVNCRGSLGFYFAERERLGEELGRRRRQYDSDVGLKNRQAAVERRRLLRGVTPKASPTNGKPCQDKAEADDCNSKIASRQFRKQRWKDISARSGGTTDGGVAKQRLRSTVMMCVQQRQHRARRVMKVWKKRAAKFADIPAEELDVMQQAFLLYAGDQGLNDDGCSCALMELGLSGFTTQEKQAVYGFCSHLMSRFHREHVAACIHSAIRSDRSLSNPGASARASALPLVPTKPESAASATAADIEYHIIDVEDEDGLDDGALTHNAENLDTTEQLPMSLQNFCTVVVPSVRKLLHKERQDVHFTEFMKTVEGIAVSIKRSDFLKLTERLHVDPALAREALEVMRASTKNPSADRNAKLRGEFGGRLRVGASARKKTLMEQEDEHAMLDFEPVHDILMEKQEQTERNRRRREQEIRNATYMPADMFTKHRRELVRFNNVFEMYDADKSKFLNRGELFRVLKHVGLQPYSLKMEVFIDDALKSAGGSSYANFNLLDVISLIEKARGYQKFGRAAAVKKVFMKHCTGSPAQVPTQDMEVLLSEVGIRAKDRDSQVLIKQLVEELQTDKDGELRRPQFEDFCQHAAERIASFATEQSIQRAMSLGLDKDSFADYQLEFDRLDAADGNVTGLLSIEEIEAALQMLVIKPPSAQELREFYKEIDRQVTAKIDFGEFLQLIHLTNVLNGNRLFALRLTRVPAVALQACLCFFGFTEKASQDVPPDELPELVGFYLGLDSRKDLRDLPEPVVNARQLVSFAKKRACNMEANAAASAVAAAVGGPKGW